MPARLDVVELGAERLPFGDADLRLHEIDAGDQLGDRVLDLQAGVHLQEVEVAVAVEQELAGAGVAVADGGGGLDRGLAHAAAQLGADHGRGRLLDHLLMPALEGALALAEGDHPAVEVAHHLDLDVARVDDVLLEVDRVVAEARARPRSGRRGRRSRSSAAEGIIRIPLPPPPAAALSITG